MYGKRLRKFFNSSKADALVIHNGDSHSSTDANYFYYTGLELDNSILIARKGAEPVLLCTPLNYELARQNSDFEVVKFEKGAPESQIKSLLKNYDVIGIHKRAMRISTYEKLRRAGLSFIDVSDELAQVRAVKDEKEIRLLKKIIGATRGLLNSIEMRVGMREIDVLKQLRLKALELNAAPSFPPIVLSGPNSRIPHGVPSKRRIRRNEVVLVDFGLKLNGYCSDLTRCYFTGKCRKEREIYEKLKAVQSKLMKYGKAGLKVSDFVKKSDQLLKKFKLPQMPHSLGHGVGIEVHEEPRLTMSSKAKLKQGMVLALEPSYYSRKFGLRYENDVLVERNGLKIL